MNKLDALKFFITASETLNFRETAIKLAISPSVVTRTIADLEDELGEPLFKRNTRSIMLTSFGEVLLPQAKQLLEDAQTLFQSAKDHDEMKGVVRITLCYLPNHQQILYTLLNALKPYPDIWLDWRMDLMKLDSVQHRIDMGIRVGREIPPNFIIKRINTIQHIFVAAPDLIERLGKPKDLEDLRQHYPFAGLLNPETGKIWALMLDEVNSFHPHHIEFFSTDPQANIQAALAGKVVIQASNLDCQEYLANGKLVQLLPEIQQEQWQLYLYRPYQTITPKRVLKVFDILGNILSPLPLDLSAISRSDS